MLDTRFKDKQGYCKLCHKVCHASEEAADKFIATNPQLNLTYSYPCNFYPSGYWHVTRAKKRFKFYGYRAELAKLGPEREERIKNRIYFILSCSKIF